MPSSDKKPFQMTENETHPSGENFVWLICCENETEENRLMNALIQLKLKKQRAVNVYHSLAPLKEIPSSQPGVPASIANATSVTNILSPAPAAPAAPGQPQPPQEKVEPAQFIIMPFSSRPQRFEKCIRKETDALMVKNDKDTINLKYLPKIPVRLVMNDKSVTVYQDDTLHSHFYTFLLKDTEFRGVEGEKSCFIFLSSNNKVQFCSLGDESFVEKWRLHFELFKEKCHKERETVGLDEEEEEKLKKEYISKMVNN
jgi:hypothetical protein